MFTVDLFSPEATGHTQDCKIYHLPMGEYADHVASTAALCTLCRIGHVPDILLSTIEVPDGSPIKGMGTLIQARVQRKTKALKGKPGNRWLTSAIFLSPLHTLRFDAIISGTTVVFLHF